MQNSTNYSLGLIIIINTIFFSGYVILKDPLAYILFSQGIPLSKAYSITTTANTLLALTSLFFGFFLSDCGKPKHSLILGILFSAISLGMLSTNRSILSLIAISFYVVGGGMYFFNIVIFLNKLFDNKQDRIKTNYLYQIFTNLGAVVGFSLFLINFKHHAFMYALVSGLFSLALFAIFYNKIDDYVQHKPNYFKFYSHVVLLLLLIYLALSYEQMTRYAVIILFSTGTLFAIYKANQANNKNFIYIISLVFMFSLPYWIANTLLFNEFFYFLKQDVSLIFGQSASFLILIDPLINAIFGGLVFLWQGKKPIDSYNNLMLSAALMAVTFLFISIGLFVSKKLVHINFIYPLVSLILFACSEFLLLSTLNATIRDLLFSHRKSEFMATGIVRSSRSFATVIGYYLIVMTTQMQQTLNDVAANLQLYSVMAIICIVSLISFMCFKRKRLSTQ